MKILILNYEYPPLGGGAGTVSRFHAEGLSNLGHQVTVVTTWFSGEKEYIEKENLVIIKLKSRRKYTYKSNPIEMLSWAKEAVSFFKNKPEVIDFDICMAHFAMPAGIPALYLKRNYRIPYIMISHGEDMPFVHKKRMLKYHIPLYFYIRRVCIKSVANVVLTNTLLQNVNRLTSLKRKEKNFAIPNGCNAIFKPQKKKFKVFSILFVGRLQDVKQPMLFLESLKLLAQKKIPFIANIAGDGPQMGDMKKFVDENNLQKNITFQGWVAKEKMVVLYQETHVQVMCSRFEAFSVAALEGLFCGAYLISTPVSGNTDIIKEGTNGKLVPHNNPQEIALWLENYYTNFFLKKQEISADFIEKFRKKYNWENVIIKYEKLMENLTN